MSPAQNRVTPLGDVVVSPLRGAWTGNRGRLHEGRDIVRFHASNLWIVCALEFKGWWHEQWQPRGFTWLFFHDEAVAFAAGHRPCALCRRTAYNAYREAWVAAVGGSPSAAEMNKQLHAERIFRGTHRRQLHDVPWRELPDGSFVLVDRQPFLVHGDELVEWTTTGYDTSRRRPRAGTAQAITPPSTLAVLRMGYPVQVDQRRKAR